MKKYQVWAIADIAMLAISSLVGIFVGVRSATIVPMAIAIIIGVVALMLTDYFLGRWYYSGTSKREKFFHGDDEY